MTTTYSTVSERIGKWKAEILAMAVPKMTLEVTGPQFYQLPKNNSKTAVFRRWLPFGDVDNRFISAGTTDQQDAYVNKHILTEGVTPSSDNITPTDVTLVMQQYGMLYSFTDQTVDMHEDDIPKAITQQLGHRMGMLQEMIDYGAVKACTNRFYGGGGGSRAAVNKRVTLGLLRKIARNLYLNHAEMVTDVIAPSTSYDTSAVEPGYVVCTSTDLLADFRNMPGWIPVEKYASRKPIHTCEKGSVEEFRIIVSPELIPIQDAGVVTASATDLVANSTNVDVYPVVVCGQNAWGKMALRGARGFTPYYHPVGKADKSDALAQRGYSGAKMYAVSKVMNNGWMAVAEVGASIINEEA